MTPTLARQAKTLYGANCVFCGAVPVQLHHNLIHGGRKVNEPWALIPLCPPCHSQADNRAVRAKLDKLMAERAPQAELEKYNKTGRFI